MSRRVFLGLVGLSLTVACALWAQEPDEAAPIRVNVTEVVVPVTITDVNGRFVTGLKKEQFELYDQGIRQDIKFFSAEKAQPVVVGFLMDLSTSMRTEWKTYQENAVEMVLNLLTGDAKYQGYLVGAGTEAELLVDTTHDPEKIVSRLNKLTAGGGVALYDAIYLACTARTEVRGEPLEPHRVLIVFGSGLDTSATHSLEEVIEIAQRKFVSIYAISSDRYGITSPHGKNLRRLADATGGRVEYPLDTTYDNTSGFMSHPENVGNRVFTDGTGGYTNAMLRSLFKSITAISGDIQQQYILRFQPNTPGDDSAKHRLEVRVNLPNVEVHTRAEYFVR
jgi:VWFA-related protein